MIARLLGLLFLAFMTSLPTWKTFGLGWARRLCRLPYEALAIAC